MRWYISNTLTGCFILILILGCEIIPKMEKKLKDADSLQKISEEDYKRRVGMNGKSDVFLTANIEKKEKELKIEYTISNGLDCEIFIFNRLFQTDREGNRTLDPNVCYVTILDDEMVCISKELTEIPEGLKVEAPEIPYLTRISPMETFKESINLTLPLHINTPYINPYFKTKKITKERIKLIIGYIIPSESEIIRVKEVEIGNETVFLMRSYGIGVMHQKFVESEPFMMSIPTLLSK